MTNPKALDEHAKAITIDAHQHFWKYDPVKEKWITDAMSVLKNDFLPGDIEPLLKQNGFDGCVVVQTSQSDAETQFLMSNASRFDFIKGVVGWIDLQSKKLEKKLVAYKEFKKLKGFRHILQSEAKRDLMLDPLFKKGIRLLNKYGFTYDFLIFPDQLQFISELATEFPSQKFVIDHIGKPYIKFKKMSEWERDISFVAQHENVFCKISGMVTEADWYNWKPEDLRPYIDVVVENFGTERIIFGSDWPVCLVAAKYEKITTMMQDYFASFTENARKNFFGANAIRFYDL